MLPATTRVQNRATRLKRSHPACRFIIVHSLALRKCWLERSVTSALTTMIHIRMRQWMLIRLVRLQHLYRLINKTHLKTLTYRSSLQHLSRHMTTYLKTPTHLSWLRYMHFVHYDIDSITQGTVITEELVDHEGTKYLLDHFSPAKNFSSLIVQTIVRGNKEVLVFQQLWLEKYSWLV